MSIHLHQLIRVCVVVFAHGLFYYTGLEECGLTLLDIVKHAVNTISYSLQENDRLAVVSYHKQADTLLELTYMNGEDATSIVESRMAQLNPGMCLLWHLY